MKGLETKKEQKKEKSDNKKIKVVSDYQKEKSSKQSLNPVPKK